MTADQRQDDPDRTESETSSEGEESGDEFELPEPGGLRALAD